MGKYAEIRKEMVTMDILDKFGTMVGNQSYKDPEKARKLLLTGYRLQKKRLQLFPDKKIPASGQYAARLVMQTIIRTAATAKMHDLYQSCL